MRATSASITELDAGLDGRIIVPGDPGYDEARTMFYGGHDLRPAVVVRAASADDVVRTIAYAQDAGLELAARSGGHSSAGHGSTDGGVQLDLADMRALEIDVEGRTAWGSGRGLPRGSTPSPRVPTGSPRGSGRRHGQHGRDHARRRCRVPRPQVRHDDRQPARGRYRDRRRPAPARRRRDRTGSVLGDPWRGRQLRCRHPPPVPPASRRHRDGRHAVPPGDTRRDRRVHRGGRGRARSALHDRERDGGAADAVPAGGSRRPDDHHRDDGPRRRRRGG